MKGTAAAFGTILVLLVTPIALFAKGDAVQITISGGSLSAPIQITDPAIVRQFGIWSGPGTSSRDTEGLNVEWSRGIAHAPRRLKPYSVSFATRHSDTRIYLVLYARDAVTGEGYIYFPGESDAGYRDNVRLIYRGIEGHWFYASEAWHRLIDPFVARPATSKSRSF